MEEHTWSLVELFISGKATEAELSELTYLLGTHPHLLNAVRGFLDEYRDADPQVTSGQKQALITRAERINSEFIYLSRLGKDGSPVRKTNGYHVALPYKRPKINIGAKIRNEGRILAQLVKTTYRQISRNRSISIINISGLAIGMAAAILIFLWVANEFSYDQFHVSRDRIYQVYNQLKFNGQFEADGTVSSRLAPALKATYSQVEEVNRLSGVGSFVLKRGDKHFESKGILSDPSFFKFFSYPFLKGDPNTALTGVHKIVLTQKMAEKLFGNEDPIGKIVKIDSTANFTVTGVLKPLPTNTQFNFEYVVPLNYMREVHWERDNWNDVSINTFVMLKPGINRQAADKLFWNAYHDLHIKREANIIIQPMADWWLYSNYENGKFVAGRLVMVRWFGFIAILIMLIACINYMNLGTARSAKRAKEVGIRKVAGAGRGLLIKQFLGESVLTAMAAGVLAIVLVQICMPQFNKMVDNHLSVPYTSPVFWLALAGFVFFTGIIAGSYPALYLSSYRPVKVLKGILNSAGSLITPRRAMVVVQFTLAIAFIICTVVIYRQTDFVLNRSKGYDSKNLAFMYIKGDMGKNYQAIKNELVKSGAITSLTRTNSPVIDIWTGNDGYTWAGKGPAANLNFGENFTDQDFTRTTGISLLEGRDIDVSRYPNDTAAILLNESAVKKIGFKYPVGQLMRLGKSELHVVGVVKDFVAGWAYSVNFPMVIRGTHKQFGAMDLRLNSNRPVADNLAKISAIVRKYNPDYPFVCRFADEAYAFSLEGDQNFGTMAAGFAGLTIFISCMGLFALAAFMAENRVKEIGIRKVLGASVAAITTLLSKDFLLLVCLSFVIATPIAWWLMSKWLENFPLHIEIGYWVFILTGAASLFIALITVGYQSLKAALLNPIKNLRTE